MAKKSNNLVELGKLTVNISTEDDKIKIFSDIKEIYISNI